MTSTAKSKNSPHQDDSDDKRRRLDRALDDALKNIFPASDPVSIEQPTTTGRAARSGAPSIERHDDDVIE